MSFTKVALEGVIKTLASKGKIYSNERQFQLDLALELQKKGYGIGSLVGKRFADKICRIIKREK